MKSLAIVLMGLFSFSLMAEATALTFQCNGPKAHYINKFSMKGEIKLWENPSIEREQVIEQINGLTAEVRKSGYNTELHTLSLESLQGNLHYIADPDWTVKPFTQLLLVPLDREQSPIASVNLVLDYPGALSSKIRMKNGLTYKSRCKTID